MTAKTSMTLYYACIYSGIKYGIEVFGSASDSKMKKKTTNNAKQINETSYKLNRMYGSVKLHNEHDILQI